MKTYIMSRYLFSTRKIVIHHIKQTPSISKDCFFKRVNSGKNSIIIRTLHKILFNIKRCLITLIKGIFTKFHSIKVNYSQFSLLYELEATMAAQLFKRPSSPEPAGRGL